MQEVERLLKLQAERDRLGEIVPILNPTSIDYGIKSLDQLSLTVVRNFQAGLPRMASRLRSLTRQVPSIIITPKQKAAEASLVTVAGILPVLIDKAESAPTHSWDRIEFFTSYDFYYAASKATSSLMMAIYGHNNKVNVALDTLAQTDPDIRRDEEENYVDEMRQRYSNMFKQDETGRTVIADYRKQLESGPENLEPAKGLITPFAASGAELIENVYRISFDLYLRTFQVESRPTPRFRY